MPRIATRSVQGSTASRRRRAGAGSAKCFVPLRQRAPVLGRKCSERRGEAPQHAVEVGPTDRGPTLHDREPVRDERKRRKTRPELLGRRHRGSVHRDPLSLTGSDGDLGLDGCASFVSFEPYAGRRLAEANKPRLRPGARREALSPDVKRLQEVGLPGAVLPDNEHESGRETQVERRVRAKAPERGPRDDQPASLIGMIR